MQLSLLAATLVIGEPIELPPRAPPLRTQWEEPRKLSGGGLLVGGAGFVALGAATTAAGVGIGGHIAPFVLLPISVAPYSVGIAMMMTGGGLAGRLDGWWGEGGELRARRAERAGWATFGVAGGVLLGGGIAITMWPRDYSRSRQGTVAAAPAYATLAVAVLLSPIAMAAGGTVGAWGSNHRKWRTRRDGPRVGMGVGGLGMEF